MTLNLKTANQSSCMTLWHMMLHHHTKYGYRRFSSWGDIVQMNIHWNSEPFLWPWPWPQQSNPIFSQHNPPYDDVPSNQVYLQKDHSSDNILKSHILITLFLTVTLTLKTAKECFWKTIWFIMMHHHTKFGSKRFSRSETITWTNIQRHSEVVQWPCPWIQQSICS